MVDTNPAIELHSVRFSYDAQLPDAVHHLNLSIPQGQWLTIVGSNGSGKTTLSKMLAAISAPSSGSLRILGHTLYDDVSGVSRAHFVAARRQVAYVTQNPEDQIVGSTVKDDVAFEPENLGFAPEQTAQAVYDALGHTGMLGVKDCDPYNLSGGQQQRVAFPPPWLHIRAFLFWMNLLLLWTPAHVRLSSRVWTKRIKAA
ncbi:energy-coupling factor ABC transporter ATP-binding protein [Alloscardovia criceti]|uniref:energy-coupling factor ABC transporter ATP-binding protein n=1 Tax=Alloscardovia criceti TaxID=356828 RepID=UPI0003A6F9B9|nr:ATP-binding cassette domain-containing protein [Alloscardovia criceti]